MLPDVQVPQNDWVEVYAATGIAPGTALVLANKNPRPLLIWLDSLPANKADGYRLFVDQPAKLSAGHSAVWALMLGETGETGMGAGQARLSVQVKS